MEKNRKGQIVIMLGLISSIITIFAFTTGLPDLPTIIDEQKQSSSSRPPSLNTTIVTKTPIFARTPTPTQEPNPPTNTPRPTATNTPTVGPPPEPIIVDYGNKNVEITLLKEVNDGNNLRLIVSEGGKPRVDHTFFFSVAVKNIADDWAIDTESRKSRGGTTDENGVIEAYFTEGDYAVHHDCPFSGKCIYGEYGIEDLPSSYYYPYIVFPIKQGYTTEIRLTLAVLEIGLLDVDGKVIQFESHPPAVQSTDIAGGRVMGRQSNFLYSSDATGLNRFSITPGKYIIHVNVGTTDRYYCDYVVLDGRVHRLILDFHGDSQCRRGIDFSY